MKKLCYILLCSFLIIACGVDGKKVSDSSSSSGSSQNPPISGDGSDKPESDKPESDKPEDVKPTPPDNNTGFNVPASMRGKWIDISKRQEIVLEKTTTLNGFKIIDNNFFTTLDPNGDTHFYFRAGTSSAKVKGLIYSHNALSRSIGTGGIGGLDVILNGNGIFSNSTTKDDGSFEFNDVPSGSYDVVVKKDNETGSAKVEVDNSDKDAGIVTVAPKEEYNFKMELIFEDNFVFADYSDVKGSVRVHNTGTARGNSLSYDISIDNMSVVHSFEEDSASSLGTLLPGSYKDIPFKIIFKFLKEEQQTLKMNITIRDKNRKEWQDTAIFHLYKRASNLNIISQAELKGYVLVDGHPLVKVISYYSFSSNGKPQYASTVRLPYLYGHEHMLVLANSNIYAESKYALGFNTQTSDYSEFKDTSAHEPNDSTADAFSISDNTSILSFMGNDLDVYKLKMDNSTVTQDAISIALLKHQFYTAREVEIEKLKKGNDAYLMAAIQNKGSSKARYVKIELKLEDPYISLSTPTYDITVHLFNVDQIFDINGKISTSNDYFNMNYNYKLTVSPDTPNDYKTAIKIICTDDFGNTWEDSIPVIVEN